MEEVTFTTVGSDSWTVPNNVHFIDVLVVAGGGGSGTGQASYNYRTGGGGGGGGLIYRPMLPVTPGESISVEVGGGGVRGDDSDDGRRGGNGGDSEFGSLIAKGGGGGGSYSTYHGGKNGGSGGGCGSDDYDYESSGSGTQPSQSGDSGTYGFGNDGSSVACGGSGGGAGGPGVSPAACGYIGGGAGKSVWGTTYARGGAVSGNPNLDGSSNTGNGAGADYSESNDGYAGGSGIVKIKYEAPIGTISGKVELGTGVENATVKVISESVDKVIEVLTDASGEYSVGIQFDEKYHVVIEYEDGGQKYNALSQWDVEPVLFT